MRYSRHLVSLRTFGLAFAVVLTPALMQMPAQCGTYVPELETLELVVDGEDLLVDFAPEHRVYEVEMADGKIATLRVTAPEDAEVMCNTSTDCPPPSDHGNLEVNPDGTAEMELHEFPPGHSMLRVWIVDDGALGFYSIHVTTPAVCE